MLPLISSFCFPFLTTSNLLFRKSLTSNLLFTIKNQLRGHVPTQRKKHGFHVPAFDPENAQMLYLLGFPYIYFSTLDINTTWCTDMTKEQQEKELLYHASMAPFKTMHAEKIISDGDFLKIDTILRGKYAPVLVDKVINLSLDISRKQS